MHEGDWRLRACRAAWTGNPTWDNFIAFTWQGSGSGSDGRLLVAINDGPTRGQCYTEVALDYSSKSKARWLSLTSSATNATSVRAGHWRPRGSTSTSLPG